MRKEISARTLRTSIEHIEEDAQKCVAFFHLVTVFLQASDGTLVYAYDKRMCYFDTLIE